MQMDARVMSKNSHIPKAPASLAGVWDSPSQHAAIANEIPHTKVMIFEVGGGNDQAYAEM